MNWCGGARPGWIADSLSKESRRAVRCTSQRCPCHLPWPLHLPSALLWLLCHRGMPRVNAKAKDSEWVRQRKAWETSKPADVNEVLLVTPEGLLLEGLTSNFFVLNAEGAMMTADEGVLSGTVRELILQVGEGVALLFVTHSA